MGKVNEDLDRDNVLLKLMFSDTFSKLFACAHTCITCDMRTRSEVIF